jgi:xanthine dehydrogenase small subunit
MTFKIVSRRTDIRFRLNGKSVEAHGLPVSTTLLDFVRAQGFTGSKEGCAEGECGACTVVVVKPHGSGCRYEPVNSCLLLLPMADGLEIYTVEALARDGVLGEAQQALVNTGASQCGYCTPGFAVSLFCEQYRPGREGACDVRALSGNLCRCTGYRPIRDAALSLGPAPDDAWWQRMEQPAGARSAVAYTCGGSMFYRPSNLAECLELMERHPSARLVAGGTDVAVESNLRHARFPVLIGIDDLPELTGFQDSPEGVTIGAGLTLSALAARWMDAPVAFREWLDLFASPLIRNRATLGGNLATASPIGDAAPLLLAFDARVTMADRMGTRTVPLAEFFQSYRQCDLGSGEILTSIHLPKPLPTNARFYKVAKRRTDDISTVAACFAVTLDQAGRVERARFAYGGVASTPIRAREAEEAVEGRAWDRDALRRAQEVLARILKPISDHRGSAEYRLALAQMLLAKYEAAA